MSEDTLDNNRMRCLGSIKPLEEAIWISDF